MTPFRSIPWWSDSRDWFVAEGSGEPRSLTESLAIAPARSVLTGIVIDPPPFVDRVTSGDLRGRTFMPGRGLGNGSAFEYLRLSYSEAAALLAGPESPVDGILIQASPGSDDSHITLGVQSGLADAALGTGLAVVAQLNAELPSAYGATRIPIDRLTGLVAEDREVRGRQARQPSLIERIVAGRVAELVPDGATIELGIGAIPDGLYEALTGHRSLTVRSGMVSDGIRLLVESGALIKVGGDGEPPVTIAMLLGSSGFYRWAADCRDIALAPVRWTHNRERLAATPGFVAINSAIEVDLVGNVNAEYANGSHRSGLGGLPDFAVAAAAAPDGMSIVALSSLTRAGRSRIVVNLQSPEVSVPGSHVTHVVTEWGVATLTLDPEQRSAALRSIAHPEKRTAHHGLTPTRRPPG